LKDENIEQQYMKSYIRFGLGALRDNVNFGGGLFFPISRKSMLGVRGNFNSEILVFKHPSENLFDLDLSLRYVPVINNSFVIMGGCGLGYAIVEKRGELLNNKNFLVEEYSKEKFRTLSGIVEIEIGYFLTKSLGISLSGYSVLTSEKSIVAYQVSLFLYRFNTK
jgi:hypothetical protein